MNDISARILAAIEENHISYGELHKLTGIPKSALQRYATGQTDKIPIDRIEKMAPALHVSAAYLMGWADAPAKEISISEDGQRIGYLYDRAEELDKMLTHSILDKYADKPAPPPQKVIPLFGTAAAAGPGEMDTGLPFWSYTVPANSTAAFAVKISGDSMEPLLKDGQIALCAEKDPQIGDVAVMMINGAMLVKQFITDGRNIYLRSINRARKDADVDIWESGNETVRCYGTVILKHRPPLVDQ